MLTLPTGESFVVEITRVTLPDPEALNWCALKVRAYQVDEAGQPLGVEIPPFTYTIALAALSGGTLTIAAALEEATSKATDQFQNYLTARRALASIPNG